MIAGVIEGFYGQPWSTDDRLECIALLDALGANAFVWAGKSEPRHRDAWNEPFTDVELRDFGRLATHRPNVGLFVGLTPGTDATATEVIEKLRPTIDRGARGVALLFDDLPVLDAADRHRDIANAVETTLGRPVWLTPTHYAGTTSSPYLQRLFDGLSP
ncbi:MAG: beta-N-acetylglucosaminidase domain-containing protein, partial [Acidimicrobiia bacterium]